MQPEAQIVIEAVRKIRPMCGEFAARRFAEKRGLGRLYSIALELQKQDEAIAELQQLLAARAAANGWS